VAAGVGAISGLTVFKDAGCSTESALSSLASKSSAPTSSDALSSKNLSLKSKQQQQQINDLQSSSKKPKKSAKKSKAAERRSNPDPAASSDTNSASDLISKKNSDIASSKLRKMEGHFQTPSAKKAPDRTATLSTPDRHSSKLEPAAVSLQSKESPDKMVTDGHSKNNASASKDEAVDEDYDTSDDSADSVGQPASLKTVKPEMAPTPDATAHLFKELQRITSSGTEKDGFRVEASDENLFHWNVHLFHFDKGSQIAEDLLLYKGAHPDRDTVKLETIFPYNYPLAPPFIRVVYPRFHQYTGHITIGGSLCVRDLTMAGWNQSNELTVFFIMIRNLLLEGGALVDMDNLHDYSIQEAQEAFDRVAKAHRWQ